MDAYTSLTMLRDSGTPLGVVCQRRISASLRK
jgi:hypothetical protein